MKRKLSTLLAIAAAAVGVGSVGSVSPAVAHDGDYWSMRSVAWNHACGAYNRCTFDWSWQHGEHSRGFCYYHSSGYYGYSDRIVLVSHNNVIFGSYWGDC